MDYNNVNLSKYQFLLGYEIVEIYMWVMNLYQGN